MGCLKVLLWQTCIMLYDSRIQAIEATTPRVLLCPSSDMSAALSWQTVSKSDIKLFVPVLVRPLDHMRSCGRKRKCFSSGFSGPCQPVWQTEMQGEAAKVPLDSGTSGGKGSCRCWCSIPCYTHSPAFVRLWRASQAFLRHHMWKAGVVKGILTCFEHASHVCCTG